jgi:hypothetical protein
MKRVIMVLSLIVFVLLIIANIIYAGKEYKKLANESRVLEQEVIILKENNEIIMEHIHEDFTPKHKFIQIVDSLHVEIINRDSILEIKNKNIIRLKQIQKNKVTESPIILENDTILF